MGTLPLLLVFLLLLINAATVEAKKSCEPIKIPLCKEVGYNQTSYPNSYGHETQEEAGLEVHQFYPLVEVNCYKHLKFFLCAMYTPICQENYDLSVMPCQEVCREAQRQCSPLMTAHGFKWPETLNCDRLPKFSEQQTSGNICAAPPDATNAEEEEEDREEEAVDNRVNQIARRPPMVDRCQCQCNAPFRLVSEDSSVGFYRVQNVSNCAHGCNGILAPPTKAERAFNQKWMLIL
jgi:frizzled protein 5/8